MKVKAVTVFGVRQGELGFLPNPVTASYPNNMQICDIIRPAILWLNIRDVVSYAELCRKEGRTHSGSQNMKDAQWVIA